MSVPFRDFWEGAATGNVCICTWMSNRQMVEIQSDHLQRLLGFLGL